MSALSKILRDAVDGNGVKYLSFKCPGCNEIHAVSVGGENTWGWNGNADKPTFTPSILIRSGHYASHYNSNSDNCWCKHNAEAVMNGEKPSRFKCGICHSFVNNGRIQFLDDCTHALAGQTIDLPELDRDGQ